MDRPRVRAILAAVLMLAAAPALAGCLGGAQASAMDALDPAEAAAKAWDPAAELAGAVGLEGQWTAAPMDEADSGDRAEAARDSDVGDGRCTWWIYRYVAPGSDRTLVVKVADGGKVAWTREEARTEDDRPLGEWRIDSDDALRIAKQANDGLSVGTSKESFGIVATLRSDADGTPVWHIMGGGSDDSGGGGGFVRIDANAGDVLASQGGHGRA